MCSHALIPEIFKATHGREKGKEKATPHPAFIPSKVLPRSIGAFGTARTLCFTRFLF